MKVYHNITDLDTVQSPHPNCTSKFKNNRECSFQCREALEMLHGRPHLVSSIGSFTERLLIRKRNNILTRVCRLSLFSPPKPPRFPILPPHSMAFLIPILGFRIRQVFLHWLTALRVITVYVRTSASVLVSSGIIRGGWTSPPITSLEFDGATSTPPGPLVENSTWGRVKAKLQNPQNFDESSQYAVVWQGWR